MSTLDLFWLHVPLEINEGRLKPPLDQRVSLLGRPGKLLSESFPKMASQTPDPAADCVQWLLFDPMRRADAEKLLETLRAKIPALSLRVGAIMGATFRIPSQSLSVAQHDFYNGPFPTLIPAHMSPRAAWGRMHHSIEWDGPKILDQLEGCPSVTDERLLAAFDLWAVASYENLPRSKFLTYLTILDSLAVQSRRADDVATWLNAKIEEAKSFKDAGLSGSLGNLKFQSHGAAVRALVERAAAVRQLSQTEATEKVQLAKTLYSLRSALSHAGQAPLLDIRAAQELAALVIDAAMERPSILDVEEVPQRNAVE